MDEFTQIRYTKLSASFVDIYEEGNPTLAAKLLLENNIPDKDMDIMKDKIHHEFLKRGWTFPEATV